MNPFDLNSNFNPFIYENISGINKDNEKQVITSFKNLIESDNKDLSPDNAMIFSGMKKQLYSNSITVRNLACDLLYKFYENKQKCENLNELTALWLFKFLEKPDYKTGVSIFKKHLNFLDIENYFVNILDFENELNLSLNGFLFILKNVNEQNDKILKYKNWFIEKMNMISFNSNIILNKIQRILQFLGPIEQVKEEVRKIIAPSLMNSKWSILLKIYNEIPNEIYKDSKYINTDLLTEIVSRIECTDESEIKTKESLYVVFPKIKDKAEYITKTIPKIKDKKICYKRLCLSLDLLDKNLDSTISNEILMFTIKLHNLENPNVECFDYIEKDNELKKIINIEEYKKEKRIEKVLKEVKISEATCVCNFNDKTLIYKELYDSFKYLDEIQIIKRAALFGISLNFQNFKTKSILFDIQSSLEVFSKEAFPKDNLDYDKIPVILKYPDEFDPFMVKEAIEKDFKPFINFSKFRNVVIDHLNLINESDLFEIYKSIQFHEEYDLFFRSKFRNTDVRFIDYEELLNSYLDGDFITGLFSLSIFNRDIFCKKVVKYLSDYGIPITTEYSADFYDKFSQFFDNVKLKTKLRPLEEIKKVYKNNTNNDEEKLLLLCINEILNCNDFECIVSDCKISLGQNQLFLEKVCKDLKIKSKFEMPNEEIKKYLKKDEKRTIDYCIRNNSFEISSLKFIDFSYLSSKALKIVVDKLCEYLEEDSDSEYYSLEDSSTNEKEICLENYLTTKENTQNPTLNDILEMIEGDLLLENDFYEERSSIYAPLFRLICQSLSNNLINNFCLSKTEEVIDQDELFEFILSGFPSKKHLFWEFLLKSLSVIRNHEIVIFIEEMLSKKEVIKLESINESLQQLFAFTFPNLYCKISKTKFNLENFIYQEACMPAGRL
ncbi:hypothetical protein NBO_560gi001 [Nosema bombycis CQ1]|uniref:Uncharacterized protein n=1 Tax=Nosema bombycis (strain CQ1 / CVCC 102059) TaxID=578461 RepID=R0KPF2_NOSB1|nr:hypothetical protein NBO_560gi001 [Nosema bombycis CQ1]|eukprot:EOB12067.1 hypothetical protein NBO_560gi001 [Nosema bombycis CQ1]